MRKFLALLVVLACALPAQAQLLPIGSLIVNLTAPNPGATVGGTVPLGASVSIVGALTVSRVEFFVDGSQVGSDSSSPYSVSWNTRSVGNGTHSVRAVARDILGVRWNSNTVTVTVFNDVTPPNVSITSPASGATVSGTVNVAASATDNVGVASVQFRVDGANAGSADASAPYSMAWNTTGLSNGTHTLTAVARDAAGNTRTAAPVSVTVANGPPPDTTLPNVSITSPANGATVSGTLNVTASASDNVGVTSVQFRLDGVNAGAPDTNAPYSIAWNTTGASNGTHTLTAVARDAAGNTRTSAQVTVTVANGAPTGIRFEEDHASVAAAPAGAWARRGAETAAFSGGTAGSADAAAATVTLRFNGTAVSWLGLKCSACGIATVAIDGGAPVTVDTAGPAAPGTPGLASTPVFSANGLAAGEHTLVIRVTGSTSSGGAHVIVDAFDVSGGSASAATRIDDGDPSIAYSPSEAWVHGTDERTSGGTYSESAAAGAVASFAFTGTEVRWLGYRYEGGGIARVFIDGNAAGEVDTYSASPALDTVFAATGLANGAHTLRIEVTGTRNPAANNDWVVIDAFDVTP